MSKTSVLIPSREEPYLRPTVRDVLSQAVDDVEVIVVLDGWWPDPALDDDPRVRVLHWGTAQGLRPSINAAVQVATGDYLFKLDAHCALAHGYDAVLTAACGETDIVVPAKYSLAPETWTRYREPWHYFYLTWPWGVNDKGEPKFWGLQDRNYGPEYNAPRESLRVDDILSYQGSAWMLRRSYWDRLVPQGMDTARYYYAQEPQELGLKAWLTGGRCRIVKDTWYAHLWKGKGHKRQFLREKHRWNDAMVWSARHWLLDEEPGLTRTFASLVEQFGPLPGWPDDWQAEARRRLA